MNKARNIAVAILAAAMFCVLLSMVVFHRQLLDMALLYSFYLQPKDFQEAQCGSYSIKEGFDECWAPYFRESSRASSVHMCWSAVLHRGICGDMNKEPGANAHCMGKVATMCKWLY